MVPLANLTTPNRKSPMLLKAKGNGNSGNPNSPHTLDFENHALSTLNRGFCRLPQFSIMRRHIPHAAVPCSIVIQKDRYQPSIQIQSLLQFRQSGVVVEIPVQLAAEQTGCKIHPVFENMPLIEPILCQIIRFIPADQTAGIAIAQIPMHSLISHAR